MTDDEKITAARALFKSFHHRDPRGNEITKVGGLDSPEVALEVGHYVGIAYKAAGDGKDYYHEFPKTDRPKVYVSYDGRQIYIVGGGYRFSPRGFID